MNTPKGWKLVPVEPTEEMMFRAEMRQPRNYRDLYAAMLDAAPTPPVQQKATYSDIMSDGGMDPRTAYEAERGKPAQQDEPDFWLRQTSTERNPPHGWAVHFIPKDGDIPVFLKAQTPTPPVQETVTVRYDLSVAETETTIRSKLIELGWTPPRQQQQDDDPPVAWVPKWAIDRLTGNLGAVSDPVIWGETAPLYIRETDGCTPVYLRSTPPAQDDEALEVLQKIVSAYDKFKLARGYSDDRNEWILAARALIAKRGAA